MSCLYVTANGGEVIGAPGGGATLDAPGGPRPDGWPALSGVPVASVEPIAGLASGATPLTGLGSGGSITRDAPARDSDAPLCVTLQVGTFESSASGTDTDRRARLVCASPDDGTFGVPPALAPLLDDGAFTVVGIEARRARTAFEARADALVASTAVAEARLSPGGGPDRIVTTEMLPLSGRAVHPFR